MIDFGLLIFGLPLPFASQHMDDHHLKRMIGKGSQKSFSLSIPIFISGEKVAHTGKTKGQRPGTKGRGPKAYG